MPTLEELENDIWDDSDMPTPLILRCHALRKKDIGLFDIGDFRILLGQGIGTSHLARSVLAILEQEPLMEADFYPGDLLKAILAQRNWPTLEAVSDRMEGVCRAARATLPAEPGLNDDGTPSAALQLTDIIAKYLNRRSHKH